MYACQQKQRQQQQPDERPMPHVQVGYTKGILKYGLTTSTTYTQHIQALNVFKKFVSSKLIFTVIGDTQAIHEPIYI